MKITEVQLENWCQYEGSHSVDLGKGANGNVVLVHADNDVGKSSLFYSIAWCLHEKQPEKWEKNDWPLYPLPWFKRAKVGESAKTQVIVTFEHHGRTFSVLRSFVTQKTSSGAAVEVDQTFLLQSQDATGNWRREPLPMEKLQKIFPRSVVDYFIFDAEKIEHFVNQSENVKQSVRRLLDIELAESAARHLQTVAGDLRKKFNKSKTEGTEQLENEIENLEAICEKIRGELDDPDGGSRSQLASARKQRKEVDDQLFQFRDAHQLLEREKEIESQIDVNRDAILSSMRKIRTVTQSFYIPVLVPAVEKAQAFLEDKRKKGELPKNVKQSFVNERIAIGECICGTPLTPGSEAHTKISDFRNTLSDELSDAAQMMNNGLVAISEKAKGMRDQLSLLSQQLVALRTERDRLRDDYKEAQAKIQQRTDIPDVPKLQLKKEHLDNRIEELIKHIAALEAELELKQETLKDKNAMLMAVKARQRQNDATDRQWMLATRAYEALDSTIASFKAKARSYLQEQCNSIGRQLFWREDVYTIHINDDYFISVTSPEYGTVDLLAGMSMGITQMTGLALIAALAKQTKASAPLIMDTPFARLSPAHITRALSECPNHFAQWILFLQPSEWRDAEYRKVVDGNIQKEFTLKRDNSTGIATIVEGYHTEYFGKAKD